MDLGRAAGWFGYQGDGEEMSTMASIWIVQELKCSLITRLGLINGNLPGYGSTEYLPSARLSGPLPYYFIAQTSGELLFAPIQHLVWELLGTGLFCSSSDGPQ